MYIFMQFLIHEDVDLISPASSARGNTSLESAVTLTKSLRWDIQSLGQRLANAASTEEQIQQRGTKTQDKARHTHELKQIVQAIRKVLNRIEDAVPLINLAITASGASLSSSLPSTVSPSRLLQASTFLTAGDSLYGYSDSSAVQIGPIFTLSMYMLFQGHLRPQNAEEVRDSTWKEVIHKADVRLMRVPTNALFDLPATRKETQASGSNSDDNDFVPSGAQKSSNYFPGQDLSEVRLDEYAYQLVIVEDLEDDRVHTFEDGETQPEPYGDIPLAGIREPVPIHQLSKIFYADTGKILNIGSEGEANSPVLLLKRDINALPPRRMLDYHQDHDARDFDTHIPENNSMAVGAASRRDSRSSTSAETFEQQIAHAQDPWRLPRDLDPEWIAFEVYTEANDSDIETEAEADSPRVSRSTRNPSAEPSMTSALSRLNLSGTNTPPPSLPPSTPGEKSQIQPKLPPIRTSLSLLEVLLRLLSLQQFQQTPHLSIPDELLTFFLSESASTGAASNDVQERKRLREEARRHVGFDPYDESPVKRRGEEYQYRSGDGLQRWDSEGQDYSEDSINSPLRYEDEGYRTKEWTYPPDGRQPSTPRDITLQSPLLLKHRSNSGTPEILSPSSGSRPPPLTKWSSSLTGSGARAERKGSPLARPTTGMTDEGLGTSPASVKAAQERR